MTFIGTPGTGVFKLGISGLTLSRFRNSFFEFRDAEISIYLSSGPRYFVFLSRGFRDQVPSYPLIVG